MLLYVFFFPILVVSEFRFVDLDFVCFFFFKKNLTLDLTEFLSWFLHFQLKIADLLHISIEGCWIKNSHMNVYFLD